MVQLDATIFAAASESPRKLQASITAARLRLEVSAEVRRNAENTLIAAALAAFLQRATHRRCALRGRLLHSRSKDIEQGTASASGVHIACPSTDCVAARAGPEVVRVVAVVVVVSSTIQL